MTRLLKICLPFIFVAGFLLSACQPNVEKPAPIRADSQATFRIHSVLQDANGEPATQLPDGYILGENVERHTDRNGIPLFIALPPIIDKSCLKSISAETADFGGPALFFSLTEDCTRTFGRFTAENIGQRMALTLNGELATAPTVRGAITGGSGFIEGGFTNLEEAEAVVKEFY